MFWHPEGLDASSRRSISYMRERQHAAGYEEVNAPELMDAALWQQSGHLEKFGENMFLTKTPDERTYAIKPMNCPGHVQIFKHGLRSYRELPMRLARVRQGAPLRALRGAARPDAGARLHPGRRRTSSSPRTRSPPSRWRSRSSSSISTGTSASRTCASSSPTGRRSASASDEIWDQAEAALKAASDAAGIEYTLNTGEGAFYGPKLEFVLRDAIGRDWQCGTLQVDLNMPERLGAYYIDEHSAKRTPGHAAPRDVRLPGALFRHPARAPRRAAAGLAVAGAGGGHEHHRPAGRVCPRRLRNP